MHCHDDVLCTLIVDFLLVLDKTSIDSIVIVTSTGLHLGCRSLSDDVLGVAVFSLLMRLHWLLLWFLGLAEFWPLVLVLVLLLQLIVSPLLLHFFQTIGAMHVGQFLSCIFQFWLELFFLVGDTL